MKFNLNGDASSLKKKVHLRLLKRKADKALLVWGYGLFFLFVFLLVSFTFLYFLV